MNVHILGFILQGFVIMALIFYPVAVYMGIHYFGFTILAPLLFGLFMIRLLSVRNKPQLLAGFGRLSAIIGISLVLASWVFKQNQWLMYYPVLVNILLLALFSHSLKQPQTIIERLARLSEPDLPHHAILYTRRVTQVWCIFFIINGTIALVTCLIGDMALWTLYNGGISYLLMGLLMAVEWCIRQKIKHKMHTKTMTSI